LIVRRVERAHLDATAGTELRAASRPRTARSLLTGVPSPARRIAHLPDTVQLTSTIPLFRSWWPGGRRPLDRVVRTDGHHSRTTRIAPFSTVSPGLTRTAVTFPAVG